MCGFLCKPSACNGQFNETPRIERYFDKIEIVEKTKLSPTGYALILGPGAKWGDVLDVGTC